MERTGLSLARKVPGRTLHSMTLLHLILVLVIVGVILWLINTYVPMDHKIKTILNIAVVIFVILWLLQATGIMNTAIFNRPIR